MPALLCGQCGRATPEGSAAFDEDGEPLCSRCAALARESTALEHGLSSGYDAPRVCSCGADMQLVKVETFQLNLGLPGHSYLFQCSSCGKQFTGRSWTMAVFELALAAMAIVSGLAFPAMGIFEWLLVLVGGGLALHTLHCVVAWFRFPKRAPVRTSR